MSIEEVYRYIDVVSQNAFLGLTPQPLLQRPLPLPSHCPTLPAGGTKLTKPSILSDGRSGIRLVNNEAGHRLECTW